MASKFINRIDVVIKSKNLSRKTSKHAEYSLYVLDAKTVDISNLNGEGNMGFLFVMIVLRACCPSANVVAVAKKSYKIFAD